MVWLSRRQQLLTLRQFTADAEGQNPVTQFDKNDVETAGLVKFDFLGLRTLTIVDWALQMVNAKKDKLGGGVEFVLSRFPWMTQRALDCCNDTKPRQYSSLNPEG